MLRKLYKGETWLKDVTVDLAQTRASNPKDCSTPHLSLEPRVDGFCNEEMHHTWLSAKLGTGDPRWARKKQPRK